MKIVQCPKCGKYIHETEHCFYCGNIGDFEIINDARIPVHENIVDMYADIESLIKRKRYDEAIALSYKVLEWVPKFAEIFWLRLLAKNHCSSDVGLVINGFDCENDPDFCNALRFSSALEHSVYADMHVLERSIGEALLVATQKHEYVLKRDTGILDIKNTIHEKIEAHKQRLFALWSELKAIEDDIYTVEMDCQLIVKEHQDSLEEAFQTILRLKSSLDSRSECTVSRFHKTQEMIARASYQSEQAKNSIESMRSQPSPLLSELISHRDRQIDLINAEIFKLRNDRESIQEVLAKIDEIKRHHKNVLRSISAYKFFDAYELLGADAYNQILHSIGISENVSDSSWNKV